MFHRENVFIDANIFTDANIKCMNGQDHCKVASLRKLAHARRGGSNEYPQSMFWSKNKKNKYTPAYPSFAI